jgi:hypothetical protein
MYSAPKLCFFLALQCYRPTARRACNVFHTYCKGVTPLYAPSETGKACAKVNLVLVASTFLECASLSIEKDIRKAFPSRLGRPGREWLKACVDCLRDITRPGVLRCTSTARGSRHLSLLGFVTE